MYSEREKWAFFVLFTALGFYALFKQRREAQASKATSREWKTKADAKMREQQAEFDEQRRQEREALAEAIGSAVARHMGREA